MQNTAVNYSGTNKMFRTRLHNYDNVGRQMSKNLRLALKHIMRERRINATMVAKESSIAVAVIYAVMNGESIGRNTASALRIFVSRHKNLFPEKRVQKKRYDSDDALIKALERTNPISSTAVSLFSLGSDDGSDGPSGDDVCSDQ